MHNVYTLKCGTGNIGLQYFQLPINSKFALRKTISYRKQINHAHTSARTHAKSYS